MKDELTNLIREWTEPTLENTDFNRGVWSRIEAASDGGNWFSRLLVAVARPRIAVALAVTAVAFGAFTGAAISHESGSEMYLRSVNPYAMNR